MATSRSGSGEPIIASASRAISYPAMRYSEHFGPHVSLDTWTPLVLNSGAHLELTLGDKLGEGTSATAYAVTVRSPTTFDLPNRLCLKVAKPSHCQVLAREAWFYEQHYRSGTCEAIVTPRYFGFFVISYNELKDATGRRAHFKP